MCNEAVVADRDEFADECMRLNPSSRSDSNARLDLDEGSNETVGSDAASVDVHWFYDSNILAKCDVDDARLS